VFAIGRNHPKLREALTAVLAVDLPNLVQMHVSPLAGILPRACCGTRCICKRSFSPTPVRSCRSVVNGDPYFRDGFGPLPPHCAMVPFNDLPRSRDGDPCARVQKPSASGCSSRGRGTEFVVIWLRLSLRSTRTLHFRASNTRVAGGSRTSEPSTVVAHTLWAILSVNAHFTFRCSSALGQTAELLGTQRHDRI
jgi:hypothetical protein